MPRTAAKTATKPARKPTGRPRTALDAYPNEGARLLAALPGTMQAIADAIGTTKQLVGFWRTGTVPTEEWRRKLQAVHGIPIGAWDVPPHSTSTTNSKIDGAGSALPGGAEPVPWFPISGNGAEPSALEDCTRLLALLRSQLNRHDLLGRERVQLGDAFARALTQKERLERAREMVEPRTIKEHVEWRRLKRLIIDALLPHPAASKAVEAAILRVLGEDADVNE